MTSPHDPFRQANYFQQRLSNDKRLLGLLLDEGCLVAVKSEKDAPLIPDVSSMTELVRHRPSVCPTYQPYFYAL